MQEMRELAARLLSDGTVKVVIGYGEGPRGIRPVVIDRPDGCGRLVFDHRCVHNLAAYLSPRRPQLRSLGKAAVILKGCDAMAVAAMIRESQLARDDSVLIGLRCGGVVRDPTAALPLTAETVADKCGACQMREPKLVHHLVEPLPPAPPKANGRAALLAELEAMSFEQRFDWWKAQLAGCIRCHACREVCPLCFCERCLADKTDPQWIESSPHARGNFAWHVARAMHLAGRCVDCGECERACPAGIPLTVIARKVAAVVKERFGYAAGDDPAVPAPIGAYRTDDDQEFIK
jgi:ferredoxin